MVDRVSSANFVTVGGKRQFVDENLASGTSGTELEAVWHNGMQESVIGPAESVGLAPSDADQTQLTQAIQRLSNAFVTAVASTTALAAASAGLILVNAAAGSLTLTLPPAAALAGAGFAAGVVNKMRLTIARIDTSGNTVTLSRAGTDTLAPGGYTSYSLVGGEVIQAESDGVSAWYQLSTSVLGKRRVVWTSSSSWTPPWGVTWGKATVIGGGGGGGASSSSSTYNNGGAGAGGGWASRIVSLAPNAANAITVGVGGYGGITGYGGPGGTSSFSSYVSATGGGGGQVAPISSGAAAGIGVGGDDNRAGGFGGTFWLSGSSGTLVAAAAGTAYGNPARQPTAGEGAGSAGANPGDGGAPGITSSATARSGGAGAAGIVTVEF
jgi:hypothetical protein